MRTDQVWFGSSNIQDIKIFYSDIFPTLKMTFEKICFQHQQTQTLRIEKIRMLSKMLTFFQVDPQPDPNSQTVKIFLLSLYSSVLT